MEDYRSGRIAVATVSAMPRNTQTAWVDISTDPDLTTEIVAALRLASVRVAFTLDDTRRGNEVAQSTGARFYPRRVADRAIGDYKQFDITLTR